MNMFFILDTEGNELGHDQQNTTVSIYIKLHTSCEKCAKQRTFEKGNELRFIVWQELQHATA